MARTKTPPLPNLDMLEGMANVMDILTHFEEVARGHREQLRNNGWSDSISEQIAANLLANLTTKAMNGG